MTRHAKHRFLRQRGAALIVVLVMLTAISFLGVSNMQSATMEMKMITATIDRNKAFALAEAALTQIESELKTTFNDEDDLYTDSLSCGNTCFNETCVGGFCFHGQYSSLASKFECETYDPDISSDPSGDAVRKRYWRENGIWEEGSDRHRIISVGLAGGAPEFATDVKYIVEFLCFIQDATASEFNGEQGNRDNGSPLFRVTVFVEGNRGLAPVMLQTNYSYQI